MKYGAVSVPHIRNSNVHFKLFVMTHRKLAPPWTRPTAWLMMKANRGLYYSSLPNQSLLQRCSRLIVPKNPFGDTRLQRPHFMQLQTPRCCTSCHAQAPRPQALNWPCLTHPAVTRRPSRLWRRALCKLVCSEIPSWSQIWQRSKKRSWKSSKPSLTAALRFTSLLQRWQRETLLHMTLHRVAGTAGTMLVWWTLKSPSLGHCWGSETTKCLKRGRSRRATIAGTMSV